MLGMGTRSALFALTTLVVLPLVAYYFADDLKATLPIAVQKLNELKQRIQGREERNAEPASPGNPTHAFESDALFKRMKTRLANPSIQKKLEESSGTFLFTIFKGEVEKNWHLNLDAMPPTLDLTEDPEDVQSDCTLELSDDNFMKMVSGELDAMSAYMSGDLVIKGDIFKAQELSGILKLAA